MAGKRAASRNTKVYRGRMIDKLTEKEMEELRMFLISHHKDGDENSYYMKFIKLTQYVHELERQIEIIEILAKAVK